MKTLYKCKQHDVVIRGIETNDVFGNGGKSKYVIAEFGESSVVFTAVTKSVFYPTMSTLQRWLTFGDYSQMRDAIENFLVTTL